MPAAAAVISPPLLLASLPIAVLREIPPTCRPLPCLTRRCRPFRHLFRQGPTCGALSCPSSPLPGADRREAAYEGSGTGTMYLFRLDDQHVVDATRKVSCLGGHWVAGWVEDAWVYGWVSNCCNGRAG